MVLRIAALDGGSVEGEDFVFVVRLVRLQLVGEVPTHGGGVFEAALFVAVGFLPPLRCKRVVVHAPIVCRTE